MTSASLLLWIVLGITLQIALWLSISFWRHWGEYQALRTGAGSDGGLAVPAKEPMPSASEPASVVAWSGFRGFRVDRKEIEDGAQSICSFYLVPEDKQPLQGFKPGQFLTFRLDVPAPDGKTEQITRCYSLSDAPHARGFTASPSSAYLHLPAALMHRAARRISFMTTFRWVTNFKSARLAVTSISTPVTHQSS